MTIKQISVFVENKPGRLAQVTKVIGDAAVDIRALSIADTSDFGILRLIVNDPDKAVQALRDAGNTVTVTEVIGVGIDDTPGAFSKVVDRMGQENIVIEYMYAFISRTDNKAFVIMRIENVQQAVDFLTKNNIPLLCDQEIYHM